MLYISPETHELRVQTRNRWYQVTEQLRTRLKRSYPGPRQACVLATGLYLLARMNPRIRDRQTNRTCWPSHRRISEELGIGLATVHRSITKLTRDGFIQIESKGWYRTDSSGRKSGRASIYTFPHLNETYYGED